MAEESKAAEGLEEFAARGAAAQAAVDRITGPPDLRTLEGAQDFLNYHPPDDGQKLAHRAVNEAFQVLVEVLWLVVPEGPGRTVFIRDLNRARMSANSAIANRGA